MEPGVGGVELIPSIAKNPSFILENVTG